MKKIRFMLLAAVLALALVAGHAAWAQEYPPVPGDEAAQYGGLFTAEELDDLLAPIALYPDPLLAQVLPASTFVDQIDEAARYVSAYGQAGIDDQPWDVSVRAVAHYPDVLSMMDRKYDWTASLGQAYVNQPQDVMDAIQRLRAQARAEGNLVSNAQQEVIIEDGYIRIVPAAPEVIYVPTYDPVAVYVEPPPTYGFITFSIGFTIGAWLNRDCDWHRHRIYYHGWRGRGWIGRARPYVHPSRSIYVNNRYTVINVNRRVVQHDTIRYRQDIRRNVEYRRERRPERPVQVAPGTVAPRPHVPVPRPAPAPVTTAPRPAPAPVTTAPRPAERPENRDLYRGREPRGGQPPAETGFGGYGSGQDVKTFRERGERSRENMRQPARPQPAPGVGARPGGGGGRQSAPRPAAPRQAPPSGGKRQQR